MKSSKIEIFWHKDSDEECWREISSQNQQTNFPAIIVQRLFLEKTAKAYQEIGLTGKFHRCKESVTQGNRVACALTL